MSEAAPVEQQVAEPVTEPAQEVAAEREEQSDRGRNKRNRNQDRFDRNRDVRGPEDRARKTRRNPHGIAEMDYGDNVIAFGGFTPAFLLVDPYGGKGAPPPTTEEAEPDVPDQAVG